jgi:hypothetical protein
VFFRLGIEQSGNIHLWRCAVDLQADRVKEARDRQRDPKAGRANQLEVDGHFLLVAVRNGLRFAEQLQIKLADESLGAALDNFAQTFPDAKDHRDVLTHIDEYILDRGRLQRAGKVEPGSSSWVQTMKDGEVQFGFGPFVVRLLATAEAAAKVMSLAEEVWFQAIQDGDGLDQVD